MMIDLFVVRHAAAEEYDPERWPDDADRPLSGEGIKIFRRAARGLSRLVEPPDAVWSSPFVRAWHTAEILADEAKWPAPKPLEELGSERPPDGVVAALRKVAAGGTMAIVGHEPMLSAVIQQLCGARVEMKKGAVARLESDSLTRGSGTLRLLLTTKVLRTVE